METPPPVNLNALKNILSNAKKVMNKVENNDFSTGHIDGRALVQEGLVEMEKEGVKPASAHKVVDYTDEQVKNSNLPPQVKEAMLKQRIPKVTLSNSTFSLDDVSDLVDKPMGYPKTKPRTTLNERVSNNNSDLITISKVELQSMINESLAQFFKQTYDKALTEDAIKKTINMLIKEGKLTVKKKV